MLKHIFFLIGALDKHWEEYELPQNLIKKFEKFRDIITRAYVTEDDICNAEKELIEFVTPPNTFSAMLYLYATNYLALKRVQIAIPEEKKEGEINVFAEIPV